MRSLLLCACLLGVAQAGNARDDFAAAAQLEIHGDDRGAATALRALAVAYAEDALAAEALFEAARIYDEKLADPTSAVELYAKVVEHYGHSRLAHRASLRLDYLKLALASGTAAWLEFQSILAMSVPSVSSLDLGAKTKLSNERLTRLEVLLSKTPNFSLGDHALYLLGTTALELGREPTAMQAFDRLQAGFPTSEWWRRAVKAKAEYALAKGRRLEAKQLYLSLSQSGAALDRVTADEGLRMVRSAIRRLIALIVAACLLALFLVYHGYWLWELRPPPQLPFALRYYLPLAALFCLAAATENRAIGLATLMMASSGALIIWLSETTTKARLLSQTFSRRTQAIIVAATAVATLSCAVIAVQAAGLTDLVMETVNSGPER